MSENNDHSADPKVRIKKAIDEKLKVLDLSYMGLEGACPEIPSTIKVLYLSGNYLSVLPKKLPDHLTDLIIDNNRIVILPELPSTLEFLSCEFNNISRFPKISTNLKFLDCTYNNLTSTPTVSTTCKLYYGPQKSEVPITDILVGQADDITDIELASGNALIDYHGKAKRKLYSTKQSFDRLSPRQNPSTREPITNPILSIARITTTRSNKSKPKVRFAHPSALAPAPPP